METEANYLDDKEINRKIEIIKRQTDYSEEIAINKLRENNFDEINVIKQYFGIVDNKNKNIKSVNQEIYKQIRTHLDIAMSDYRKKIEKNEK
jgi:hypothetical protein